MPQQVPRDDQADTIEFLQGFTDVTITLPVNHIEPFLRVGGVEAQLVFGRRPTVDSALRRTKGP